MLQNRRPRDLPDDPASRRSAAGPSRSAGERILGNRGPKRAILVGGGIGIAPLIPWAEHLQGVRKKKKIISKALEETPEVLVLIGGKSRERILGIKEFKKMGLEPQVATEDGSLGMSGSATDLLERELMTQGRNSATLYACGPMPMLARVSQIADQFDLPCQVLLEARMACGVGACLGCAVKVKERSFRAKSRNPESRPTQERWFPGENAGEEELGSGKGEFDSEDCGNCRLSVCPGTAKKGPSFEGKEIFWE